MKIIKIILCILIEAFLGIIFFHIGLLMTVLEPIEILLMKLRKDTHD